MRKLFIAIIAATLTLSGLGAFADSVQGSWSGTARALGRSFSATCSFDGSGGFTAKAAGMSVSGSYSISGSSVTLSAKGTSITFSLSTSGNRQSMSGSGRYRGVKGSISLSRSISDSQGAKTSSSPYGKWSCEAGGTRYEIGIYESGFLYWSEVDAERSGDRAFELVRDGLDSGDIVDYEGISDAIEAGFAPEVYLARIELENGAIELEPIGGAAPSWEDDRLDYKLSQGKLNVAGLTFEYVSAVDKKPSEAQLRPYITLARGDKGEAVKSAQERLIAMGFLNDKADGSFGPKTEAAVKAYESAYGFTEDGVLSSDELLQLYNAED